MILRIGDTVMYRKKGTLAPERATIESISIKKPHSEENKEVSEWDTWKRGFGLVHLNNNESCYFDEIKIKLR
jgi:hypothetical protein